MLSCLKIENMSTGLNSFSIKISSMRPMASKTRSYWDRMFRKSLPRDVVIIQHESYSKENLSWDGTKNKGVRRWNCDIVRLRYWNIAQLLGYCRHEGEFILVYDFMSHGSLDKILHDKNKTNLGWVQRYRVIKDVASDLLYLHEGWEQLVIHWNIKANNVMLDGEMNRRLEDFGLTRLC